MMASGASRPGDRLTDLFAAIGIPHRDGCGCSAKADWMNERWMELQQEQPASHEADLLREYRRRHGRTIAGFLADGAASLGMRVPRAIVEPAVRLMFARWIRLAKKT
jgi:hypothetical protein